MKTLTYGTIFKNSTGMNDFLKRADFLQTNSKYNIVSIMGS